MQGKGQLVGQALGFGGDQTSNPPGCQTIPPSWVIQPLNIPYVKQIYYVKHVCSEELVRTGATNHQEAKISLLDFILQVKLVVIAV